MRSLRVKLILAFLITSVAGMALAAIFIRQSVANEFDSYVVAQRRASFVEALGAYYERVGSWDGIDRWLHEQSFQPPPGPASPPPDVRRFRLRFGLVDTAGVAVLPFGRYTRGEKLDSAEIARGTPVLVRGRPVGTIIIPNTEPFRNVAEERYLAHTDIALGIAALVMVAIALLLGMVLARLITRPVRELTDAAQKIAAGELEQQVPVRSRDELGLLAAQFNQMSADLSQAIQLRRQMTADVAHDLRTPLTVISGYLEALRDQVLPPTPERFARMYEETQLLLHLVEDLHTLSLADAGELSLELTPIPPHDLLERVAETYRHTAEQQDILLCVEAGEELPEVSVDVEQLTRALNNLVGNALRYTPRRGRVTLSAHATPVSIELSVIDTGSGIAPEHLPSIFERFYRADSARRQETGGSGLGLAIVKSIVDAHGGQVGIASTIGQGTQCTIVLPHRAHVSTFSI